MNKKHLILGVVVFAIVIGIISSVLTPSSENMNIDMQRTHGGISTAMGSPIFGESSAPITIVEFGDYQCHFCNKWFHETKPSIDTDYIETGKVNLIFVDLAFLGKDSQKAAQATYCAEDQGKYWDYHNHLYNLQEPTIDGGWANTERLKAFAFDLGLDMDLFGSCLDSGKYFNRVKYNTEQAKENGVNSTPGFFIIGPNSQIQISGAQPYSVFKQTLDSMM